MGPAAGPGSYAPARSNDRLVLIVVVVVVAVVAIGFIASALLFGVVTGPHIGPGSTPIGAAFAAGNPVGSTCSTQSLDLGACAASGDWIYEITIEASTVQFNSILFEVIAPTGAIFQNTGTGEFAIVDGSGNGVATIQIGAGGLAMTTTWTHIGFGYTADSPLTSAFTIVVDTGQAAPTTGMGLSFVGIGTGEYSGITGALSLP
jgi:hypothetical protein